MYCRLVLIVLLSILMELMPTTSFQTAIGCASARRPSQADELLCHVCGFERANRISQLSRVAAARPGWMFRRTSTLAGRKQVRVPAGDTRESETMANGQGQPSGERLAVDRPQVQLFEDWTKKAGCRGTASLCHADFDGLRGLMTEHSIDPWQPLATIPMSLALTEYASSSGSPSTTPVEPLSEEAWNRCPWWVRLGVRLLAEEMIGESSSLHQYVGILPQPEQMGTPLNWSTEQLERVFYPRMRAQVAVQRRVFRGAARLKLFGSCQLETEKTGLDCSTSGGHVHQDGLRFIVLA